MSFRNAIVCSLFLAVVASGLVLAPGSAAQNASSHPGASETNSPLPQQSKLPRLGAQPQSVGVADPGYTWPLVSGVATVYYQIQSGSGDSAGLASAINTFNNDFPGVIQWVNCASNSCSASITYVNIYLDPSDNSAAGDINTIGYPPPPNPPREISLNCAGGTTNPCSIATLLHEMGHVIGLYHEQTRTDSGSYVTVNYGNVVKSTWPGNFQINTQNQQLLTPYDYASVMQYPPYVDTRNGAPVIESKPAGIPMQGVEGLPGAGNQDYSAGDKEAILRLYGHAPTEVTVTSNPVGLQVIVDGTTVTTPQTYAWGPNSTHTLNVPAGVQTLTGDIENSTTSTTFYYTWGNWNDLGDLKHNITITPGNGSPAFPVGSPAVATYSANFIQLVPYTETVTPSGGGTVTPSPAPQTYTGASGEFFVARQLETLTATPNSSYNFYEFNAQYPYFWLPGGLSANPKEFFVPDTGNPVAVNAEFTTYPVYTVNVVPADTIASEFSDGLYAYVDNGYVNVPKNFSPDPSYDASWSSGSMHTLSLSYVTNPDDPPTPPQYEYPYSSNSRFLFPVGGTWSDGEAYYHTITLSSSSTTYTATLTPEYMPATNFDFSPSPCGGAVPSGTVSGNNPDGGFYPWGTQLTFTADPTASWYFGGWTYDLTGTTNPNTLTPNDESLVYANFNTNSTPAGPLTLTGLNPTSVTAGSGSFTLTLSGSGFNSGTEVYFGSFTNSAAVTSVTPTQIQATVNSAWVQSPGTLDVWVENAPSGSACGVFGYDTFAITAETVPTLTWNPATTIIYGNAGSKVLNASANVAGNSTYSATPTGGGSSTNITSGTSSLPVGTYNNTVTFTPSVSGYSTAGWTLPLTVSGESVWILGNAGGLGELAGNGYGITSSAYPSANEAVAIDHSGNVWTAGSSSPALEETSQTGSIEKTPTGGGLSSTVTALAIDGNGQVWVSNEGNTISLFTNGGTAVSPTGGIVDPSTLSSPSGIAVDLGGSVWIANGGNNTLTRVLGAAAPVAPLATAAKNNTTGAKP